ncbi:MAG: DUF1559 domain-containing protein, partial [Gemmataceae bacterium]
GSIPTPGKENATTFNYGHSWLVLTLPYIEQGNLYSKLDLTGSKSPETATGLVYANGPPYNNGANGSNGTVLSGVPMPLMYCPSSQLPKWGLTSLSPPGPDGVFRPTYTAIAGAIDHSSTVNRDSTTQPHDAIGRVSFGGIMVMRLDAHAAGTRVAEITDGTSNTLLIGEQSDWCVDSSGAKKDCRSDFRHGFTMGPRSSEYRNWNTTSVRYKINAKNWNLLGVGNDFYAPNPPIQSAHPGGAVVGFADGSAQFLNENLDLQMLFNLSNRDDGKTVSY